MSSSSGRRTPSLPICPTSQVGRCAVCHHPTHRYGHGGNPLCPVCRADLLATQKKKATPAQR
ncbi:hypothetical protein [Streptomyces clavuligerus]|uniref:hypothetical protein n=1 Tax=Streptomyces clavuligerus TaxID=1901 RepID=UPI0012FEECEA|nr:hypothetical protein [Streptomyces clavuligerus]WDN56148.1 hypothetical protein LL058_30280 [Streptomyces clavuligerus]